jgi:hypothetical protein
VTCCVFFVSGLFHGGADRSFLFHVVSRRDPGLRFDFGNLLYLHGMCVWHDPCDRKGKQHPDRWCAISIKKTVEVAMKKSFNTFQKWMTAITFAEAGEWDIAQMMSPVSVPSRKISQIEQTFMAAAFAEAGLYDDAVRMAEGLSYQAPAPNDFLQSLGLGGVRVTYGVLAVGSAR